MEYIQRNFGGLHLVYPYVCLYYLRREHHQEFAQSVCSRTPYQSYFFRSSFLLCISPFCKYFYQGSGQDEHDSYFWYGDCLFLIDNRIAKFCQERDLTQYSSTYGNFLPSLSIFSHSYLLSILWISYLCTYFGQLL